MKHILASLFVIPATLIARSPFDPSDPKVGVYTGEGTQGLSAPRWLEIAHFAPNFEAVPLDAVAVTNGTLDACTALILPHGDVDKMAKALGETGRAAIRTFIEKGGNCLASNGGARLLTPESIGRDRVSVVPYGEGEGFSVGETDELHVDYIPELEKSYPIRRARDRRLAWDEGVPFVRLRLEPGDLADKSHFTEAAHLRGNVNLLPEKRQSLVGQLTDIYGTYGKGRVWATMMHSELVPLCRDVTRMLLQYVLGSPVDWQLPQREKGQLVVSVIVDRPLGVAGARTLLRLLDDKAFDVTVMTQAEYDGFWLRHSDAVVRMSELDDAAIAKLHALKAAPEEPAKVLTREKIADPVKAVLYCGPGVGDSELFNFATILDDSPKYTVECQDGDKIKDGSLSGKDFILVAGGYTAQIYERLKDSGEALRAFLENGGTYYGACAGSIVPLQPRPDSKIGLSLVPYTWRFGGYRGHAHPHIEFTDDAKAWGLEGKSHRVLYWGGPEHQPGTPIPGYDVRVLARFGCESIDTYGQNNQSMMGWSAIVGGSIGKGKIISNAIHPEEDETQFYLVYAALRYLHGEQPAPQPINRRRGALTVGYFMPFVCSADQMAFALELRRDTRFDVRPESGHMDVSGFGRHLDVYVFGNGFPHARLQDETVEFFRRGGTGLFISSNPSECAKIKSLTKDFPNVKIVPTLAEAKDVLAKMYEELCVK